MRRLMVISLVSCLAAGAANAQMVAEPLPTGWEYTRTAPRGPYAYLEDTWSEEYMVAPDYGFVGLADDIHFGEPGVPCIPHPIHMTDFHVVWYSCLTPTLLPITMDVCFYAYDEIGDALVIGDKKYCHYTVTGLGTGLSVTDVDVVGPCWLPCDVWMEVCFRDKFGAPALDTGLMVAGDTLPDIGCPSYGFWALMNTCCEEPPSVAGIYSEPHVNFCLGITVPEPLTLGLIALGGLLVIRGRR